jgi:hypothetical protein
MGGISHSLMRSVKLLNFSRTDCSVFVRIENLKVLLSALHKFRVGDWFVVTGAVRRVPPVLESGGRRRLCLRRRNSQDRSCGC